MKHNTTYIPNTEEKL